MANPTVTHLSGREIQVTPEMEAQAFWLLRRYTSLAFIQRTEELWRGFLEGLEEATESAPDEWANWFLDVLGRLFVYQAGFERGLEQLRHGSRALAFRELSEATNLGSYLYGRRFEGGMEWTDFGFVPGATSVGLFSWAERACILATRTCTTLRAGWSYQAMLLYPGEFGKVSFPPHPLPPLPRVNGPLLGVGQEVPISGIYVPLDLSTRCPNYLIQGLEAPQATVPIKRVEWAAQPGVKHPNGRESPPSPAHGAFEFGQRPTRWQLVWENRRYLGGALPDEAEYLLGDTDPPAHVARRDPALPWPRL